MPTCNVEISEEGTFILFVDVAVPDPKDEDPAFHRFRALVDTGANATSVTQNVVDTVGAVAFGKGRVTVANGETVQVDRYRLIVVIPITTHQINDEDGNVHEETYVSGGELAVLHLDNEDSSGYDVLLGMDLLSKFHITMFGGHFILSN